MGHRSTEWCPRCGTSLSQHELTQSGVYQDRADPSLTVRFPLARPAGRVARDLDDDAVDAARERRRRRAPGGATTAGARTASGSMVGALSRTRRFAETVPGAELVGLPLRGAVRHAPARRGASSIASSRGTRSRVDEGTGIVHIAPGCGGEDFELSRVHDLPDPHAGRRGGPLLRRLRLAARHVDRSTRPTRSSATSPSAACSSRPGSTSTATRTAGAATRRSSSASPTTGSSRVEELRQPLLDANATVEWTPAYMGKRMDDWLRNMGDWNISRRRYYGLPLPFYPCACGQLNVIGSKAELLERATGAGRGARGAAAPVGRRRHDPLRGVRRRGRADRRGRRRVARRRDRPVLDARLGEPRVRPRGLRDRRGGGLTGADLPDHAYWEEWFPADWVSEMREQIRLWFYSQLFMSVALTGRAPFREVLGYEKMLDETGREMHGSWGNMIDAQDAFARMGADVMRWQYCAQPPDRNLLFGFGPAHEIQRKLLTLWNSVTFLVAVRQRRVLHAALRRPRRGGRRRAAPLDRWLVERTRLLVEEATDAYERWLTVDVIRAFEAFVDDLSNWYIRRSRRRFWDGRRDGAPRRSGTRLVQSLRVIAPVMPFLAEHLWQVLVREPCARRAGLRLPRRAGRKRRDAGRRRLLAEMADVAPRRRARPQARGRASGVKLRQPLRALVVEGASLADEPRRRDRRRAARQGGRRSGHVEAELAGQAEPAGARPEARQGARRRARGARRRASSRSSATVASASRATSSPRDEVLVERRRQATAGRSPATDGVTVALDTAVDDELVREGRVYELIHQVNTMRKEAGLELTDRIAPDDPGAATPTCSSTRTGSTPRRLRSRVEARRRATLVRREEPELRLGFGQLRCSRRSSTGRRNVTSSSTIWYGSIRSTPRARNQSQTPRRRAAPARRRPT